MTMPHSRREFLADVGRGMVVASIGAATAVDLGLTPALADDGPEPLSFGPLEPLVALMQETPISQLVPILVERLKSGTQLKPLVAAAALANARTFGGEDYVGYHTMMALAPAYHMARELPPERRALPVLKVLYRNTNRIQEYGGRPKEVLRRVEPDCCLPEDRPGGEVLREVVRRKDLDGAERTFATLAQGPAEQAFNDLLYAVQDNTEVHRVVLPYRAWDLLDLIGREHAHTLLRQSVRYCVKSERDWRHTPEIDRPRTVLPKLLDQYRLVGRPLGTRAAEDAWVEHLSRTIFEGTPESAAEAVAAALAEGMAPDAVGEAISQAANQLVLRDKGRRPEEAQPGKPAGSVHGDSIGVHACDAANAWRQMTRATAPRNTAACLILGAFQVAWDRVNRGGDFLNWQPRPLAEDLDPVKATTREALLGDAEEAIRANDQARACAVVYRYGELGYPARPVFDLLLRYAISEDGALHAEKYYRTVSEEFATTRPAFRWRQLTALARVTASEYGRPAAGVAEASRLLGAS
ncbi:MAG: hypothetical protein IRY99_23500 [Isosphaeraceae bacterium]|nr:hypothetical protein [Isosphaeraceae bacterium]